MGIVEEQSTKLLADLKALNLKRYVSEVADALGETKLAPKDTNAAVQVPPFVTNL